MQAINVELVGGPMDGQHVTVDGDLFPGEVYLGWEPLGSPERDMRPRYVQSRKLTRQGRLIYEFRGHWVDAS